MLAHCNFLILSLNKTTVRFPKFELPSIEISKIRYEQQQQRGLQKQVVHVPVVLPPGSCINHYTSKSKLLGVVINNNLTAHMERATHVHKSSSSQYRVMNNMRYQPQKLMEVFYFLSGDSTNNLLNLFQGNCSVAMLSEIENVRLKVARVIHKFPQNVTVTLPSISPNLSKH